MHFFLNVGLQANEESWGLEQLIILKWGFYNSQEGVTGGS